MEKDMYIFLYIWRKAETARRKGKLRREAS